MKETMLKKAHHKMTLEEAYNIYNNQKICLVGHDGQLYVMYKRVSKRSHKFAPVMD